MAKTTNKAMSFDKPDVLGNTLVYAGPTMHRRKIIGGSVYRNGLPGNIEQLIAKVPEVGKMIVPVKEFLRVRHAARTQGTEYHRLYQYLESVRFDGDEVRQNV